MPAHSAGTTTPRDQQTTSGSGFMTVGRRKFLGYLVAAPTLVVVADIGRQAAWGGAEASAAALPSPPQTPELYEFVDNYRDLCVPTNPLLRVEVKEDGRVAFALPRSDNGQGIQTLFAMVIAEEMGIDPSDVDVTLADARPELLFNQLTGGSSTTYSLFTPVRVAAAIAKGALLDAAALALGSEARELETLGLTVTDTAGKAIGFGELSRLAAVPVTTPVEVLLKPREEFTVLGKSRIKDDARAMVTGAKKFVMDIPVPDALPTVICRAPDLNGAPDGGPSNIDEVRNMPGVTDVAPIGNGIAVRAETFGQAIDGANALEMNWKPGTVAGKSDDDIVDQLRRAELPLVTPAVPGKTLEQELVHYSRNGSALETNCAIVSFKDGKAEVWAPAKSPIAGQKIVSQKLGIGVNDVTFHVVPGGGSFGRRLFNDHVQEASEAAKAIGKPVKLMWDRANDCRQGRVKPLCVTRVRAVVTDDAVASFELRYTGVNMEVDEGLTDVLTSQLFKAPAANLGLSETFWEISVHTPYNFGVNTRLMLEVNAGFNTGSTRNVYGPDTCTARELMIDRIAERLRKDPVEFRTEFVKTDRLRNVIQRAADEAGWGRSMPEGTAQGIGVHQEYKAATACVVEIDARPETVNRQIRSARTGPRVTKVTFVVDPGLLLNPTGYEAQMLGGINDGIANAMTAGLHLVNGSFVEASWDNYFYTRQWNTPPEVNVIILEDSEYPEPAGAGEASVAATMSAVVNAFRRATGTEPEYTPVLHKEPFPEGFTQYPTSPPIPESPRNGLDFTF
ncbi:xanthine dehydrogenase family protein molybdopterin-binding subunit [Pseudonocardia sp. KRD-184]|uniref:Xanthine dehydrogenase family protein molybdopterin-binding subunit n=1 Tax=Pseudonocardia oceani TaxID=2792013 RepID=A0ABS6UB49_9PSEU|nr:molybdopterin cofactor-binding domain-containing protein [Pseudonocardia oceani]MBW0088956.1 xanthine dehydrogenase family protein molybdopterin-binding subunit [Pseudonocardia oceani]MBW0094602.1 xanthine dehydrogenase family protein molybdopterin-binding subunit [Pseudonocardia oceani]MBW0107991.1 xanthine dehydrogenase family protein molybdopterin-binding subunit [Pseudonocardia oceani]MBW0119908.1 xanthine dehydrogenase family protein molybdopterin-binding subunit [Pseudonocardia oceani]